MSLGLNEILAPLSVEAFLREHWGRRSARGSCEALRGLTTSSQLLEAIEQAYRQGLDLSGDLRGMLPHQNREDAADDFKTFVRHVHPEDLDALLKAGLNLNIRHAERFSPPVKDLVAAIGGVMGDAARVRADSFLTRAGGGGFSTHFDGLSVLTLQVEGQKQWRVWDDVSLPFPLTSATRKGWDSSSGRRHAPQPPPPSGDPSEVLLQPGDWLFVPAGAWHRTDATGHSLAITIVFVHERRWTWLADLCAERFAQHESWRSLSPGTAEDLRYKLGQTIGDLQAWLAELERQEP